MNWSDLPQQYKDLANVDPKAFIQDTEDILARYILAFLPLGVNFWVKCWEAKYLDELPKIPNDISHEDIQKDIALFVAFFYSNEYTGMGVLATFDIVYGLAKSFVETYHPSINWEEGGIDYESTAHKFILDNFIKKEF